MNKFASLLIAALALSLSVAPAYALTLESGDNVVLDQVMTDDVYILAGNASVEADVRGDLYIAGGNVSIEGDVQEDLVVVGGRVTVMGDVEGDLRVMGGEVFIYGEVGDDLIVAGGKVNVKNKANVKGSVLAGAGFMSLEGTVNEDIQGGFGALFLSGRVNGNVVVAIQENLDISDSAHIGQNLEYSALLEADIPANVVKGETSFNQYVDDSVLGGLTQDLLMWKLFSYLSALLLVLLFVILAPMGLVRSGELVREHVFKAFGIGLLTVILAFVAPIILMMTIIGIPLALIVLAMLFVVFYIAQVFVAAWLATYLLKKPKRAKKIKTVSKPVLFGLMLVTLLVYHLIGLIPYVGWIVRLAVFFIGVGGMFLIKKEIWLHLRSKKMI